MKDAPFTADRLLALYDRVAEAEDAIPRLRRFVLDLAVRGKLVEQDPTDEPVRERFQNENNSLSLPKNWGRLNFGRFCDIEGGNQPAKSQFVHEPQEGYVQLFQIRDLGEKGVPTYIPKGSARSLCKEGDILIGRYGASVGKVFWAQTGAYNVAMAKFIWPQDAFVADFAFLLLKSDFLQGPLAKITRSAQAGFNKGDLAAIDFPLPPLAEQQRIVAKVDELMALCDRLQAARAGREAVRDRLSAATLTRLTAPEADAETFPTPQFQTHARFALQTLPTLTTRPAQIKTLRQTILNLAVRGKLVEQDPTDEPAAELLKRIAATKAHRVKTGQIPKKADPVRDPVWGQGGCPAGWSIISLGQVTDLVTSGSRGWGEFYSKTGPGFIRAQNIRFGRLLLDDLACVNPPSNSEGSRTQVVRDDLLIVITGAGVTNPALLDRDLGEAYVSQHVGLVRPTDKALSPWLLHCLLANAGGRAELVERAYGAGKPGLNLDNIRNLTVPLPPLPEQHRIVAQVDALMALCDQLEASLTTATTTRSRLLESLLHEALNGALGDLPEAAA